MPEPVLRYDESLGQRTRNGDWPQLAVGTYSAIRDKLDAGELAEAAELIEVTLEEAEELRQVFGEWPGEILGWIAAQGVPPEAVKAERKRVAALLRTEHGRAYDRAAEWDRYVALTGAAAAACRAGDAAAAGARAEEARTAWLGVHDYCVDEIYGLLDAVVRACGEDALPGVWNHLMRDWYDDHAARLDVRRQPWTESARQLMTAIVHGFHGHLSGTDREGGMTFVEEDDRYGFRFDPCGSGGRMIRDDTTGGKPRPAEPFSLAVTTRPHDWSFGRAGVQAYCVHCCLLNMVMPIDRMGYPTRVIEPPTWPQARAGGQCQWWVYKDPALVPDEVYRRVGRERPAPAAPGSPGAESSADSPAEEAPPEDAPPEDAP
jgi:hypothetical protein